MTSNSVSVVSGNLQTEWGFPLNGHDAHMAASGKFLTICLIEIEEAMENKDSPHFEKYNKIREQNLHKMISIPVCKFEK